MKLYAFIAFMAAFGVGTAYGSSMCLNDVSSTSTYQASANEDNNRGSWTNGDTVSGESHCSKLSILTAENADQFETNGQYCWCRVTYVAAPNGYMARRSGAWVFRNFNGSTNNCAAYCASYCASDFRSSVGFRRALFASPGS